MSCPLPLMEKALGKFYDSGELETLEKFIQRPPLYTTVRVNTLKCSKEEAKKMLSDHFTAKREPFQVDENPDFPDVLMIKAIGPKQVSPSKKEIIVDSSAGASLLRGADLYSPGIIGMEESINTGDLVSIWADLDGNCSKGLKKTYKGKKVFIGNGLCLVERKDVFSETIPLDIGVKMTEMEYKMPSLNGILTEFIFLQNLPSVSVAQILNPSPNSRVLDMCSSPGGKTCHAAAIMKNTGNIIAIDKIAKKTIKIQENCDRLGIKNVQVMTADSSKLIEKGIFERESFDYIILDPPCSGLGLRPKLKFSVNEWDNMESFAAYQRKLFMEAWGLLKVGGEMSYSTCTINPLENELLVDKMLSNLKDAELLPIREGFMEKYCLPGLQVGNLDEETCKRCICRFWPSPERDSNGFFFVKFRKVK